MKRLVLLVVLACACSESRPERESPRLSGPASAWAAMVASGHEQADKLLDAGDAPGARRLLTSVLEAPPPRAGLRTEIRRVLLQDTYFRLARLELDGRDAHAAAGHAAAGLALGGGEDLFVANLLVARGAAREALGETRDAVADYDRAARINEALLQHTLAPP
jgi:hypothetical protein